MTMQLGIISLVILAVLAGGALLLSGDTDTKMKSDDMMENTAMEKDVMLKDGESMKEVDIMEKDAMSNDEAMMKDESAMEKKDDVMMAKGSIQNYSPEKIALAATGKVLLFFHASWCPICRQLDAEAAANPNIVPDGVTVLKVDYDTATALKQKYGVTVQHTFVQVDATGSMLQKFSTASDYSTVFGKVQ